VQQLIILMLEVVFSNLEKYKLLHSNCLWSNPATSACY